MEACAVEQADVVLGETPLVNVAVLQFLDHFTQLLDLEVLLHEVFVLE